MRRRSTIAAATALAAGAVLAGRTAGRRAVRRLELRPDPHVTEPFGSLRGTVVPVRADDGTRLYAEVDGTDRTDLAIVFSHGWTLTQDSWHFQRKALRGLGRLVFWDQRGHGRSGGADRPTYGIPQLAHDLAAVIEQTVPEGTPVVLIGHSMGGMTIMRYADEHPGAFGHKVMAVGLLNTSSGGLGQVSLGLPATLARLTQRVIPHGLRAAGLGAPVIERLRHLGRDGAMLIEDYIAFGPDASPAAVRFCEQMMADTRLEAMVDFFGSMISHETIGSCTALAHTDTLVIGSENDVLTPLGHSLEIVTKCPTARLEIVPVAGHMAMLERPSTVSDHLGDLIGRAHKAI
ncbi:alpha/beta fold hydrolase [Actinomadura scrupuli]|uniref:alpha/beta fold hydrolase n=1 Tax=Actinomadura scrupuli TaxID=559629 RepID=UPI003D95BD1E